MPWMLWRQTDGGGLENPAEGPQDGHRVPVATVLANGVQERCKHTMDSEPRRVPIGIEEVACR